MTRGNALTYREGQVLRFIAEYTAVRGYPPSMRETGDAVGLTSTSSVAYVLRRLADKGHIRKEPGGQRAISLTAPPLVSVPRPDLRELLAAADSHGALTEAQEGARDRITVLAGEETTASAGAATGPGGAA